VTLTSCGTTNLLLTSIVASGDFAQRDACPASIAPGSKCLINVTFTPTGTGTRMGAITITDNAANGAQTVPLTGTGVEPVVLTPTSLNFGNVGENSPSFAKNIKLTNNQSVPLTVTSVALSNPDYKETDGCVGVVAAMGNCNISVTLTPGTLGADNGTLTVNDNALNSPQAATLTGTGVVPVKFLPATLNFGNVPQGTTSTSKLITLYNYQDVPLNISQIAVGNADFTVTQVGNFCNALVPAMGHCTITITFTPSIIGADPGLVTVTDDASNSPQKATLSGTGIVQAKVAPASLTFAAQTVGTTSAAKTVTLTNNLSTALTINSITFTGTDPGDFASPTNTCGTTLAANSTCTISVTFTPAALHSRSATLNVNDSANNSPQTVALTGTGK
jgi:sorbitol-specific phosphotransferase system component IIA